MASLLKIHSDIINQKSVLTGLLSIPNFNIHNELQQTKNRDLLCLYHFLPL